MYSIYEEIKERITVREAVERYHIGELDKNNRMLCIFHQDSNPSMSLKENYFHCFSCGAHGSVIDIVMKHFGITDKEAVKMLASDFGLSSEAYKGRTALHQEAEHYTKSDYNTIENEVFKLLISLKDHIRKDYEQHKPKSEADAPSQEFIKVCSHRDKIDYYLEVLVKADEKEKADILLQIADEMKEGKL